MEKGWTAGGDGVWGEEGLGWGGGGVEEEVSAAVSEAKSNT